MARIGFCDPTSLLVFINPFSPYERVRHFLLKTDDFSWKKAASTAKVMAPAERLDFIIRLTAIAHERQHFQEFMLTRHGAKIVREHVLSGMNLFAFFSQELERLKKTGAPLVLPLNPSRCQDPEQALVVAGMYNRSKRLLESCRQTMECSAMLAQRLAVYDGFGLEELKIIDNAKMHLVYRVSQIFDHYVDLISEAHSALSPLAFLRLFMMTAMTKERPDSELASFVDWLERNIEERRTEFKNEIRDSAERMLEAQTLVGQFIHQENVEFIEKLRLKASTVSQYLPFVEALENFDEVAHASHSTYCENLVRYLHAEEKEEICSPHVFDFAEDKDRAFVTRESAEHFVNKYDDDLYAFWLLDDGKTAELQMAPHPIVFRRRTLDRDLWIAVAKGLSGARVIFTGIDWDDPLCSYWVRVVMERMGASFIRG